MQVGWSVEAAQCSAVWVSFARVVWRVQGCGMVHQWWCICIQLQAVWWDV